MVFNQKSCMTQMSLLSSSDIINFDVQRKICLTEMDSFFLILDRSWPWDIVKQVVTYIQVILYTNCVAYQDATAH